MSRRRNRERSLEPVTVDILDLDEDGRGVARIDGKVTFVHGALPGERVEARVRRRRRSFDEAELVSVLTASPDRVTPPCEAFDRCGGCALQHLAPAAQIAHKQRHVIECLTRLGGVEPETVLAPISGATVGYRRRARLGAKWVPGKGATLVGFRERHAPYIADVQRCHTLRPEVGERLAVLRSLLSGLDVRDRIPQIEVAVGDRSVALVLRHLDPIEAPDRERLVAFAREHGVEIYLQSKGPDTVRALEPADADLLEYDLDGLPAPMRFAPVEFVQVHGEINQRLVADVVERLDAGPQESVLDLFCGLGNFTLPIATRAGKVVGVEGDAALVERARGNAAANRLDKVGFEVADLADPAAIGPLLDRHWDRLLLDPPRSGAAAVVAALGAAPPSRIVYVSCHPATLARDAGELVRTHGYRLRAVGVVDMFPHTSHVESRAVFER